MTYRVKDIAEFKKLAKPIKKQRLEADIGESATAMLLKQAKQIDKLAKAIKGLHSNIEQMNKRIYELEMKE
jgi:hypothetical protein